MSKLIDAGRVEETIYFPPGNLACLTYALMCETGFTSSHVRFTGSEILVAVPMQLAVTWAETNQVGIYANCDLGPHGSLALIVEKDFACMDLSDGENLDTFPNPKAVVKR